MLPGFAFPNHWLPALCLTQMAFSALVWGQDSPLPVVASPLAVEALPNAGTTNPNPVWLPTVAEQSGFTATATGAEVEMFLRTLANVWPEAELSSIGSTVEGRPLWSLIVAPKERTELEPLTVLLLGGIHSGECDGKEAMLALARDLASGQQGEWWHTLRLIFVPNLNADGNERRGGEHRPGQAGPSAGMGIRENAQGIDLNRDFVKLESPEVRSLVAMLNEFDVDVLIDTHTTNGSLHRYHLTYDIPHNPAAPQTIDAWLRSRFAPSVTEQLSMQGIPAYYYGNFSSDYRRWMTFGHEPRFSTEYMGLRGKIGILAESYSYASYQTRFHASYHFLKASLAVLVDEERTVRSLIDAAASSEFSGHSLPIRGQIAQTAEAVSILGYQGKDGSPPGDPPGFEQLDALQAKDYSVQLWNRGTALKQVTMPAGYIVPQQYAWAASRLVRHGIQVKRLRVDTLVEAEAYTFTQVEKSPEYQRHATLRTELTSERKTVLVDSGSIVVETSQPLGKLAAYLLEPDADDSLVSWNFFDPDIAPGNTYPVLRLTTPLALDALSPLNTVPATEQITLDRLMAPAKGVAYGGDPVHGAKWLKNKAEYVVSQNGRTLAIDAQTGASRRLSELDSLRSQLEELEAFTAEEARSAASIHVFTDDWKRALISHENDLYFFDAESNLARQLTHSPGDVERLAELSPDGKHVAFVQENNLWVVDCDTSELKQLTRSGSSEILNGTLDWVYQEELYGRGNFKSFWWSPDGMRIAFLRLDESPVPHYQVADSLSYAQTLESTRYPKAGQPLPLVSVWLADVHAGELTEVDLAAFPQDDRLVGRASWSPAGDLWLQVFNRVQNKQDLVRVDPGAGTVQTVFTEVSPGWIEIRGTPQFLPDGDFLWLSDVPTGRTHLFRVSSHTGQRSQVTSGEWDVESIARVAEDGKTAFVTGDISSPIEKQLIAVQLNSGEVTQITFAPGTHQTSVDASGRYFIDVFSSTDSQPFAAVHSIDGQMLRVIEAPISDRHEFLQIQPPRNLRIQARDGVEMQTQLLLPAGFNAEEPDRKLPVLFYVYGGPQTPTVSNSWEGRNYWWHQMLCQQGLAVVLCDNRSARGRGIKDTWTIRGDLCRVELRDLEDAVTWVAEQPWANRERIGVWGWSYGGYFTAYAMTHSTLFRCGIAGAPVTDWRNYDAIYTERYMDLPQRNESGYDSSSVVEAAANLHGRLLLIHGERDDNVHISNTLQLAHALQLADKQFDLMIYPENRHAIVGPAQKYHLHRLMTDFLQQYLLGNPD